jgi:hypothetical protein
VALPPDGIVRAAVRWLRLLQNSTVAQGWALIRADSGYVDLSPTQYAAAFDWLQKIGLLQAGPHGPCLSPVAHGQAPSQLDELMFVKALETEPPAWLQDADVLVRDADDVPHDAATLAATLGLSDQAALLGIRQVHGHMDIELRQQVGALGERALVDLLERSWPGSTEHVALDHDGFGYDIALSVAAKTWHLEVKTTTRRGRLSIHLSRHEYEVGQLDPCWELVVVGLDQAGAVVGVATADRALLLRTAPSDAVAGARWQTAQYDLERPALRPGLAFLESQYATQSTRPVLSVGTEHPPSLFDWMPSPALA